MRPTVVASGRVRELPQDGGVGEDDADERYPGHDEDAGEVVRDLPLLRREEVERDALLEPCVMWVPLHVEYDALKRQGDILNMFKQG